MSEVYKFITEGLKKAAPGGAPQRANKTSLPDRDLLRNTAAPRRGLRLL